MEFEAQQGFRLGERTIHPALNRIVSGDDELTVEGKVMDVLVALARHPDAVVSKQELLDTVWPDRAVTGGLVIRAIHEIRRALGDSVDHPSYIENVRCVGYRLLKAPQPLRAADVGRWQAWRWRFGAVLMSVVTAAAAVWHFTGSADVRPPPNSVAVLPFVNMTGDEGKSHMVDAVTEMLIQLLMQHTHLNVSTRESTLSLRDTKLMVPEIGDRLNVDFVIEGSVRQERTTQRITVQLIDASTGLHKGSSTIDIRQDDLFVAKKLLRAEIAPMLDQAGIGPATHPQAGVEP